MSPDSLALESLALLRSLAIRPSEHIAPSLQGMVGALEQAGYIARSPSGWLATAKGCEAIERRRSAFAHPLAGRQA